MALKTSESGIEKGVERYSIARKVSHGLREAEVGTSACGI
jgi:hypothetical protein